jgi:PAS domain S-box-containing protein
MDIANRQKFTEVIFENIRDGIVMIDRNYRIITVNSSVEKWVQKPASDLIDKDCREIFHDKTWICPHCAAKVTFETGQVNVMTQTNDLKDGVQYAELSSYPILDEAGEVAECVVTRCSDSTTKSTRQRSISKAL